MMVWNMVLGMRNGKGKMKEMVLWIYEMGEGIGSIIMMGIRIGIWGLGA